MPTEESRHPLRPPSEHIITDWRVPRAPIRWRYRAIALTLSSFIGFVGQSVASALEPERRAANEVTP